MLTALPPDSHNSAEVLDRYAELERIRSVDEFQLVLSGSTSQLEAAIELVQKLKAAVSQEVGPCIRFSAGIGQNHLLAKIAGKLEKPNGCQWLGLDNMPARLAQLQLDALPGISRAMRARLEAAGVRDIHTLFRLDPRHARLIWRSVEGERFVRALQGEPIPLLTTKRGGYGNSKVLAPEFRAPPEAYLVSRWLIEKAAARLRRDRRVAAIFTLHLAPLGRSRIVRSVRTAATQSTPDFLRINRLIWREAWPLIRTSKLAGISIHLGEVDYLKSRSGDLLLPVDPAEQTASERASSAADQINRRYGAGTIQFGINQPHPGFFERG